MIVVVGCPALRPGPPAQPGGLAGRIAAAAAGQGPKVQLIGKVGDDLAGDELVLALTAHGVGHVALLRDPVHPTPVEPATDEEPDEESVAVAAAALDGAGEAPAAPEERTNGSADPTPATGAPTLEPADVELGLRYLTAFDVVVLAGGIDGSIVAVAAEAAEFAGARLVVVVEADPATIDGAAPEPAEVAGLPPAAILIEAPAGRVPDAGLIDAVAIFLAELDAGREPASALETARTAVGAN